MPRTQSKPPSGIKNIQRGQFKIDKTAANTTTTRTITVNAVDMKNTVLYANCSRASHGGVHAWQSTSYWEGYFMQPEIILTNDTTITCKVFTWDAAGPGGNGREATVSWQLVEYW